MKKFAAILFSFFYLAITIGIAVNIHYCQGELESIQLLAEQETWYSGDDAKSSTCCNDNSLIVQFENEQTLTSNFHVGFDQPVIELQITAQSNKDLDNIDKGVLFLKNDNLSPPEPPVWLLNCSFVFYG